MTTEMICVTFAPPALSAQMPPIGRINAPMNGPIHANIRAEGPLVFTMSWVNTPSTSTWLKPKTTLMVSASAAEKPIKLPNVMV